MMSLIYLQIFLNKKILCTKCGKYKSVKDFYDNKGRQTKICHECRKVKWREGYQPKKRRRLLNREDLRCPRCRELKKERDFYYSKEGKRIMPCKQCNKLHNDLRNPNRPKKEKFRCTICNELKTSDDFYYIKSGPYVLLKRSECKECNKLKIKNHRDIERKSRLIKPARQDIIKRAEAILLELNKKTRKEAFPEKVDNEIILHNIFPLSDYKTCPECGIRKPLADFWDVDKNIHYECNQCRNKTKQLFDQFIYGAF